MRFLSRYDRCLQCLGTAGWVFFVLVHGASTLAAPQSRAEARAMELAQGAQTSVAQGDYDGAVEKFREALAAYPEFHQIRFELGRVLAYIGRYEESAAEFAAVVTAMPEFGAARRGEVTALLLQGRYADARAKLQEGLDILPRDGQLAHTLARLLATAPVDRVRDGQLALHLALKVYEIKKTYETGETLAMAYAEVGNFEKAVEVQRGLVSEAEKEADEPRAARLRERLLTFLRNEAWRAASPAEIAMATEPPRR